MARPYRTLAAITCAAQLALAPCALAHHGLERILSGPDFASASTPLTEHVGLTTELIVDDRVLGTTIRYVGLSTEGGRVVRLRGEGLAALAPGTRVRVTGQLDQQTLFVRDIRIVEMASTAADRSTKKLDAIEGRYTLIHADDFEGGESRF